MDTPSVYEDGGGMLVVDWHGPRPLTFEITAEVLEALILEVNLARADARRAREQATGR